MNLTADQIHHVKLADIIIGHRHRQDLGDIAALAASIRDLGLLHPPVVTPDGRLIAGRRRLEAFRELGLTEVPVRFVDLAEVVRGEYAENTCRKDFTHSEKVAIGRALEVLEKEKAKERQKATRLEGKGKQAGANDGKGKFPPPSPSDKGKVSDKVAAVVGMSGKTYEKAKAVVEAAEQEPEKFGPAAEEMDRTGKVDPSFRKVKGKRGKVKGKRGKVKGKRGPTAKELWQQLMKDPAGNLQHWLRSYAGKFDNIRAELEAIDQDAWKHFYRAWPEVLRHATKTSERLTEFFRKVEAQTKGQK
jgi:hypothetical protein